MPSGPDITVENLKPLRKGEVVLIYVRPEEFTFAQEGNGIKAKVLVKRFLGKYIQYIMDCGLGYNVEGYCG